MPPARDLAGPPADAYEPALQHAAEKAVFGGRECRSMAGTIRRSSLRSPSLVAAVPYAWGLAIWPVASFAAYLATFARDLAAAGNVLVAAAFPAVFINIGHGQNGFLTAALLGGALHLARPPAVARRRPDRLLAYKPQFGVLIPSRCWPAAMEHDRRGRATVPRWSR